MVRALVVDMSWRKAHYPRRQKFKVFRPVFDKALPGAVAYIGLYFATAEKLEEQNMHRIALGLIAALLIGSAAMATTTCPSGNYGQYVAPTSITCATNFLQFSQFGFQAGGTFPPTAASIGVIPIDIPGNEGFQFNPAFSVVNGQSEDATVTFEVSGLAGALISDLGISFNGSFQGSGSSSFTEEYCTDGFGLGTCHTFSVTNPPEILNQEISITPTAHLFISKDFNVTAPAGAGNQASISSATNQFSQVPEPSYFGVLVFVFPALIFFSRRKSAATA